MLRYQQEPSAIVLQRKYLLDTVANNKKTIR